MQTLKIFNDDFPLDGSLVQEKGGEASIRRKSGTKSGDSRIAEHSRQQEIADCSAVVSRFPIPIHYRFAIARLGDFFQGNG